MSNVKFEFNVNGLREVLKSPGMVSVLQEASNNVANAANGSQSGYGSDTHILTYTAIGTAFPTTREAGLDNYLHNTLLKALQSSGLKMR